MRRLTVNAKIHHNDTRPRGLTISKQIIQVPDVMVRYICIVPATNKNTKSLNAWFNRNILVGFSLMLYLLIMPNIIRPFADKPTNKMKLITNMNTRLSNVGNITMSLVLGTLTRLLVTFVKLFVLIMNNFNSYFSTCLPQTSLSAN